MIWCVEDDADIRDIEVYTLRQTGFSASGFPNGEALFSALKREKPELIILDIMLPGDDGVTILKRLRSSAETHNIPVIMATAKGMEYDKVQSLDLGADDYLVKPFGMMEMVSRVKAVLRRSGGADAQHVLKAGGLVLNTDEHTVTADGERVNLTYKEYELLKLFLSGPGTAFTREQLFDRVWGENFIGESRTLDMHIRTLRQKLGKYGSLIETIRGVGYKLEVKK
ncbi:MAG: response regulator transcription factor [Candidatus Limivicinus sp.]|jgi:two-component system alkaline phosphatase synthesis response regulator PhoP